MVTRERMKEAEKERGGEGSRKPKKSALSISLYLFAHRLMSTLTSSCAKAQKRKSGREVLSCPMSHEAKNIFVGCIDLYF